MTRHCYRPDCNNEIEDRVDRVCAEHRARFGVRSRVRSQLPEGHDPTLCVECNGPLRDHVIGQCRPELFWVLS